MHLAKMKE